MGASVKLNVNQGILAGSSVRGKKVNQTAFKLDSRISSLGVT
jgi:hypothetical protein